MAGLTEEEVYELAVYLIEITDAVIGGANGIANLQAKQLANRTAWLKANKQDKDATLTALAALVGSANKVPYFTAEDVLALMTVTPFARTILDDVDAATMRATLDIFNKSEVGNAISTAVSALVASSPAALDTLNELAAALGNDANFATNITNALANKQDKDATLTSLAALIIDADKMIYGTGTDTFSTTTLTAFARTLLDDANGAAMFTTMGATQSLGANGYTKLPNGLILQWGSISRATWTNFPITFPNSCFGAVATVNINDTTLSQGIAIQYNQSQIWAAYGTGTALPHNYIAIGN